MLTECKENICHLNFIKQNSPFFSFSYTIFIFIAILHLLIYILLFISDFYITRYKKIHYNKENGNIIYHSYIYIGELLQNFIIDAIHGCNEKIFCFLGSFFLLLLCYNCASIIPHFEELTNDLNVCLAFAIYGFLYVQYIAITETGLNYLNHWISIVIKPKKNSTNIIYYLTLIPAIIINTVISIILFPFTILEKISLLFSLTFRLFGNIFGGSIVVKLLQKVQNASLIYYFGTTLFGVQLLVLLYFSLFEGIIQAFIFSLILLNNIGTLINKDH